MWIVKEENNCVRKSSAKLKINWKFPHFQDKNSGKKSISVFQLLVSDNTNLNVDSHIMGGHWRKKSSFEKPYKSTFLLKEEKEYFLLCFLFDYRRIIDNQSVSLLIFINLLHWNSDQNDANIANTLSGAYAGTKGGGAAGTPLFYNSISIKIIKNHFIFGFSGWKKNIHSFRYCAMSHSFLSNWNFSCQC